MRRCAFAATCQPRQREPLLLGELSAAARAAQAADATVAAREQAARAANQLYAQAADQAALARDQAAQALAQGVDSVRARPKLGARGACTLREGCGCSGWCVDNVPACAPRCGALCS